MTPPKALAPSGYVPTWADNGDAFKQRLKAYAMRAALPTIKRNVVQIPQHRLPAAVDK